MDDFQRQWDESVKSMKEMIDLLRIDPDFLRELTMKKTDAIYYSGQGIIYRCPECHKVDRAPYDHAPKEYQCRFCKKEFEMVSKANMTPDLYKVIREINYLETGTIYGASPEMLEGDNLVKAGKSVGVDVLDAIPTKPEKRGQDSYFAPWRIGKDQLREWAKTEEGKEILAEVKKLVVGGDKFMDDDKPLVKEVWMEAKMTVLMKKHKGLTNDEKIALLKKEGFNKDNHEVYVNEKGVVCVFFSSTVAPECDSWMEWR